nr:MAG TPA: hypothetical protein [Caudoviricetes sp.]
MNFKKGEEVYNGRYIETDGYLIVNPTEEMLLAAGYLPVEETAEERLANAKRVKVAEIEAYSNSDAVNEFTFKGIKAWLTPDIRSSYSTSLRAAEFMNKETLSFAIGGQVVNTSAYNARLLLAQVQLYADDTYMVTQLHKTAVMALNSIEAVLKYDYKQGYPAKLNFE